MTVFINFIVLMGIFAMFLIFFNFPSIQELFNHKWFPIKYNNYVDVSYGGRAESHSIDYVCLKTGKTRHYAAYNEGYLDNPTFKFIQHTHLGKYKSFIKRHKEVQMLLESYGISYDSNKTKPIESLEPIESKYVKDK